MSIFTVKVRAGIHNFPSAPPEDGDFELEITGTVAVEAPDADAAKARALDVLESDDGWKLVMDNGDGVEFEAVSAELAGLRASDSAPTEGLFFPAGGGP